MKQPARDLLRRQLGSRRAGQLAWRDMWALVAIKKGKEAQGESFSRSPEFNSWGAPVVLRAEVPLAATEEASCLAEWREAGETGEVLARRKEFCDR